MKNQSTPHCDCLQKEQKFEIKTPETHIKKETICYCTPEECDCTVTREENETSEIKQEKCKYVLDYDNKCDCREDDNCGCTYPNNLPQDFKQECKESGRCTTGQSDAHP